MYRKGEPKPDYKDKEEQDDAEKTRESFLRSILYPQQPKPTQQQLRQLQSSHQDQPERQQRQNQQLLDEERMRTSILPSVSPQHLSLPTMVPVQMLPRTPQEHSSNRPLFSPMRSVSQRKGSEFERRSNANLRSYQYHQGETEANQGIEIITPDLNYQQNNFRAMKRQPHLRRKAEVRKQNVENPDVICNCPKSRCLKLYCDCFQAGELCNTFCHCRHCLNTASELVPGGKLYYARKEYNKRDPNTFVKEAKKSREGKGCSCRNSKCLKKYCVCFRENKLCTEMCSCVACCNGSTPEEEG